MQHGEGVGSRVNVEGEEGGPGERLEGGGVAVFSLSTVKTLARNLHLWSSQLADTSSPSCRRNLRIQQYCFAVLGAGCEGRGHGVIPVCHSLPQIPFSFSLCLLLLVWGLMLMLCQERSARTAFPPAHSLQEVPSPSPGTEREKTRGCLELSSPGL